MRFFAEFFRRVRPLQLRDILNDIGPKLFSKVVEAMCKRQHNPSKISGQPVSSSSYLAVESLVLAYFATF